MGYKVSNRIDAFGVRIREGDIIMVIGENNAGYGFLPFTNREVHCVVLEDGVFGSDVYSDFEPLKSYYQVSVLGHVEDYRRMYNGNNISGNYGEAIKFW